MGTITTGSGTQTTAGTYPSSGILREQLVSGYDAFNKEEYAAKLYARYGYQYMNTYNFFRSLGREEIVSNDEFSAFEENRYHSVVKLGALEVENSWTNISVTKENEETKGVYVRVGDIITMPGENEFKQLIVTNKTGNDNTGWKIDLETVDGTDTSVATGDGDTFIITNGAFAAGSGQPEGTVVGVTKRDFQAQIFKESVGLEGSQMVNQKWATVMDDGRNVVGYYTPGTMRAEYLLGLKIDGAFAFGQKNADTLVQTGTDDGSGNKIKTTEGAVQKIKSLGGNIIKAASAFGIDDLEAIAYYMKQQGVDSEYALAYVGSKLNSKIDRVAFDYIDGNGTDYTKIESAFFKRRELSLSVNFQALSFSGFTFIKKENLTWSDPATFGATGYTMNEMGMFMPLSNVLDAKTQTPMPNVMIKSRGLGAYNRRLETWSVGGAGAGLKVTDVDRRDFYFRAHLMFVFLKANQMVLYSTN